MTPKNVNDSNQDESKHHRIRGNIHPFLTPEFIQAVERIHAYPPVEEMCLQFYLMFKYLIAERMRTCVDYCNM